MVREIKILIRANKSLLIIFLIIFFGILASRSLFVPGFYSSHDGVSNVVRLVNFYQGLLDGQVIPRWSGGLAFGFGSPVLLYYGQLPYITGLIPKLLGASFPFSIEIVTAFSLILSGITFFVWAKEVFGEKAAFIGSLFYVWAPYRFLDIYVRGAYPENFAFIFPPLILVSVLKIFKKSVKTGFVLGVVALSGIILSHNVMALFFISIFIFYAIGLYLLSKDLRSFMIAISSFVSSLLIAAFYWVPAFLEKKEVYLDTLNVSASHLANFIGIRQILYSRWGWGPLGSDSPMSLQIGIAHEVMVFAGIVIFFVFFFKRTLFSQIFIKAPRLFRCRMVAKITRIEIFHFGFFLILFFLSIFLMTSASIFLWTKVPLLSFVLYPWRFLAIVVFSSAVLTSFVILVTRPNFFIIILILSLLLYTNRNHSQLVGRVYEEDSYYENYQDTADIWGEYLPKTADLEVIKKCRQEGCRFDKVVAPKDSKLEVVIDKSNLLAVSYDSQKDFVARINTFYFSGWNFYLDKVPFGKFTINDIGTMDINLPQGKHQLELKFEDTDLRKLSLLVSLVSLMGVAAYLLCWKKFMPS